MVDVVLSHLSRRFDAMYAKVGRPSIAPEKLLRAQLLQMLYSIRSAPSDGRDGLQLAVPLVCRAERGLPGVGCDDIHQKNRDRLLEADIAKELLAVVVAQARWRRLTSDEHFTVDGTLRESLGEPQEP
jgi:transposase